MTRTEALDLARRLRMDITNAQGKLTDIINYLEELPAQLDVSTVCPFCHTKQRGPLSLAEHVHRAHAGPYPEHWAREDQLYAKA